MTTTLIILAGLVAVWLLAELGLHSLVAALKPSFQWLIVPRDLAPPIPADLVEQYMERSFDPELGWLRRPGSIGSDRGDDGVTQFHIDANGCRRNPGYEESSSQVAVFGDSYAFCRLAADDETWPHFLSETLGTNVRNFGVGNYGIDQALLRLERELPSLDGRLVIMCIVHESIARAHSFWKHYFEYGNVLAFKPRFVLDKGQLVGYPPPMQSRADFASYRDRLSEIQKLDRFYRTKFVPDLLRFPYVLRIIARWRRHAPILWHLVQGTVLGRGESGRRSAIRVVAEENRRATAKLFADPEACELLTEILKRFARDCLEAGRTPLLLVLPQPVDVEWRASGRDRSEQYFIEIGKHLPTLDLTNFVLRYPNWRSLYVGGHLGLGPHFNAAGNRIVAEAVAGRLTELDHCDGKITCATWLASSRVIFN